VRRSVGIALTYDMAKPRNPELHIGHRRIWVTFNSDFLLLHYFCDCCIKYKYLKVLAILTTLFYAPSEIVRSVYFKYVVDLS
jgi:hypothetical protein